MWGGFHCSGSEPYRDKRNRRASEEVGYLVGQVYCAICVMNNISVQPGRVRRYAEHYSKVTVRKRISKLILIPKLIPKLILLLHKIWQETTQSVKSVSYNPYPFNNTVSLALKDNFIEELQQNGNKKETTFQYCLAITDFLFVYIAWDDLIYHIFSVLQALILV